MGKLASTLTLLMIVVVVGIAGYMVIEQMSFIDAAYMTIITITTVGYDEVHPLSEYGKVFTIFLIVVGIGIFALFISMFAQWLIEKSTKHVIHKKEEKSEIDDFTDFFNFISPDKDLKLGVIPAKKFNGKKKVDLLREYGFVVVGVKKGTNYGLNIPLSRRIKASESLLVLANDDQLANARLKNPKRLF